MRGAVVGIAVVVAVSAALIPLRDDISRTTPALTLVIGVVAAGIIGGRAGAIVANLLSLSRIEAGAFQPRRQAVALDELVSNCLARLTRPLRHVLVEMRIPPALPLADADYSQLDQVVTNLLENAARHASSAATLRIETSQSDGMVALGIEDDGPGVPRPTGHTSSNRSGTPRPAPRAAWASRSARPSWKPTVAPSPSKTATPAPASCSPSRSTVAETPIATVLVVDDEPPILRAVRAALEARHYQVLVAATGQGAIDTAATQSLDAIILDLGLPDFDGVEVCRRIRQWSQVPIIVLTVESAEERKVIALDEGADDYLTKPFSMPELLARIRVALRHRQPSESVEPTAVFNVGDLRIDLASRDVSIGADHIDLTPKEFAFLALLARYPGRVLTHRMLLQEIWGPHYRTETQYLRVYASQLRKKLRDDPDAPRLITEPGVGYRLIDPQADS
jgi:two-component system KDP operon response regulator KdpE